MADILSLSVSGKGLFAFNNADPLALQSGQLFAGEAAEDPAEAPVIRGDSEGQSGAFASFASLFDSQLDDHKAGKVGVLPQLSDTQLPSHSLFFSGEPLTASPLGKFQLSSIDGDGLPGAGRRSPNGGDSLPVQDSLSGPLILDPAQSEAVIAGGEALLSLGDAVFSSEPEQSPQVIVNDSAGLWAETTVAEDDSNTAYPTQKAAAESAGDIFDDLAFLPEKSAGAGNAAAEVAVEAAKTVTTTQQQLTAVPGQDGAADVETAGESADIGADETVIGKSALTGVDEAQWRQQNKVASGSEASEASRFRESPVGRTERLGPDSSRQQFAEQLAQSTLAEGESSYKTSAVREQLAQVTSQAPAGSHTVNTGASELQQTTRMDSAMSAAEQAKTGAAENKSVDIRLAVPFSRKDWSEQLGKQLGFLVSRNMDSAQIQLDPPELGPLQVRIQLHQEQVSLQFHAQHGIVREAVDQSLVRLQELFSEEGLELVSVDVSDGESNRESTGEKQDSHNRLAPEQGGESDEILTPVVSQLNSDGKIDYFI